MPAKMKFVSNAPKKLQTPVSIRISCLLTAKIIFMSTKNEKFGGNYFSNCNFDDRIIKIFAHLWMQIKRKILK